MYALLKPPVCVLGRWDVSRFSEAVAAELSVLCCGWATSQVEKASNVCDFDSPEQNFQ